MFANAQVGFEKTQDFILVSKERRIHHPSGFVGFPIEFGGRLLECKSQLHSKQLQSSQNTAQECIGSLATCFQGNGRGFEQFKGITDSLVEDTMKEAPKRFDRYVRKTLDAEQHEQDYKEWKNELEAFQKENPSHLSFDELYGKVTNKRKRKEKPIEKLESKHGPEEDELMDQMTKIHDEMDICSHMNQ
jgi:hypothetical protein